MTENFYETDRAVSEYLLFHYCLTKEFLPPSLAESGALDFPVRCVTECLDPGRLSSDARGLDLGCAVGRASFELARFCHKVIGIDYSQRFIAVAQRMKSDGVLAFAAADEGDLTVPLQAAVSAGIDRMRVVFETGDATNLRDDLGQFEVVLMANLIDRLKDPERCLRTLPALLKNGGQLILTSPYTWTTDYAPRENWLGGFLRSAKSVKTIETLRGILSPNFDLLRTIDLPFLIREHSRKFQFGISEATIWIRK